MKNHVFSVLKTCNNCHKSFSKRIDLTQTYGAFFEIVEGNSPCGEYSQPAFYVCGNSECSNYGVLQILKEDIETIKKDNVPNKQWEEMSLDEKMVSMRYFPEKALDDNNDYIRFEAYRILGFTEKAFDDKNEDIRIESYRSLGYTEKALDDTNWKVRLEAYRRLGFTEKALNDVDNDIRYEAYRILGFTEKAFNDSYWRIRLEAYRRLGFTEKALDDKDSDIRREAKTAKNLGLF